MCLQSTPNGNQPLCHNSQYNSFHCSWKPLEKPSYGTSEMKRWKTLLELDKSSYAQQVEFLEKIVLSRIDNLDKNRFLFS